MDPNRLAAALCRAGPHPRSTITQATPVRSSDIPTSSSGFHAFRLHKSLQRGIDDAGFTDPRPIQRDAIPAALDGDDVLGLAQTGTGKTGAFAIPIIERVLSANPPGPSALIIAPTRELVLQIHAELKLLAKHTKLRAVTVFGGIGANPQIRALRARPDVIVACPGRLLDLTRQGHVDFSNIETLVLDEADHMFDQGFLPDIKKIIAALPRERQNLLFSATMPKEIRGLADNLLYKPHVVELTSTAPAATIEHALYPVSQDRKLELLNRLLREDGFNTAIVFLRTKRRVKHTALNLAKGGLKAVGLQGNMSQQQRVKAMEGFRKGKFDVLVATDIAARGIDVANVSQVINFDVPDTPDTYTHRIGRTGRAEATGRACTLYTNDDHLQVKAIERKLGSEIPRVRIDGYADRESRYSGQGRSQVGGGRSRSGSSRRGRPGRGRGSSSAGGGSSRSGKPSRSGSAGSRSGSGAGRRRRSY